MRPVVSPPVLLVTFGLPGAGKSFVARALEQRGFHAHDGDDELPADMRAAIERAVPVTEEMRDRFVDALVARVALLLPEHPRLVIAQTFLKQRHRTRFLSRFPQARFVLVRASDAVRVQRLEHRTHQPLDAAYTRKMVTLFDEPLEPYAVIENTGDAKSLEVQLDALVQRLG